MEQPITRCGKYHILKTKGEPSPFQRSPRLHRCCLALRWLSWTTYIYFQFRLLRHIGDNNPVAMTSVWLVLLAEILLNAQLIILAINALFPSLVTSGQGVRPRMRLVGDEAPKIVVMIPCCGEMPNVVLNTIRAAAAQDYPTDQLRVYVLDDGGDSSLERGIEQIQLEVGAPKLRYLCRKSSAFFKAGNLDFGIKEMVKEDTPEFLASLDADMIPDKQWLRRVVPHLLLDSSIGLACPPQVLYMLWTLAQESWLTDQQAYYNAPSGDPLAQQTDLDVWFRHLEYLNDSVGAAMCTGSGFVARTSALISIGGWPLSEAGEDYMCSSVLNAAGWKTIFVPEPDLQLGLCPNSLDVHISQRQRWVDSGFAVHKHFRYWASKERYGNTTLSQRIVRILQLARELSPLATLFSYMVLPWTMASLRSVEVTASSGYSSLALYAFFLSMALGFLTDRMVYGHLGYRKFNLFLALDVWCAPCEYISTSYHVRVQSFNGIPQIWC